MVPNIVDVFGELAHGQRKALRVLLIDGEVALLPKPIILPRRAQVGWRAPVVHEAVGVIPVLRDEMDECAGDDVALHCDVAQ